MDQELNVTRRTTKPFIPTNAPNYWGLQRQVQAMEEPIPQVKAPRYVTVRNESIRIIVLLY
jgi:hypothetical protein